MIMKRSKTEDVRSRSKRKRERSVLFFGVLSCLGYLALSVRVVSVFLALSSSFKSGVRGSPALSCHPSFSLSFYILYHPPTSIHILSFAPFLAVFPSYS